MLGACLLQTPEDEEGDEGGESNPLLLECPPKLVDVHAMLGYKGVWKRDFLESCPPGFGSADPLSGVTAGYALNSLHAGLTEVSPEICFCLPGTGIISMCHHTQLFFLFFLLTYLLLFYMR